MNRVVAPQNLLKLSGGLGMNGFQKTLTAICLATGYTLGTSAAADEESSEDLGAEYQKLLQMVKAKKCRYRQSTAL